MSTIAERRCSFCLRVIAEGAGLVAGPGVAICADCVSDAAALLRERSDGEHRQVTWEDLSDADLLEHLPQIEGVAARVSSNLRLWVGEARRRGLSWARIGESLGVSRQAAWERFGRHQRSLCHGAAGPRADDPSPGPPS